LKYAAGAHIDLAYSDYANNAIVNNNLFHDPMDSNVVCNNCIEADPQFIDPDNNNFNLSSTSPAINNGTASSVYDTFEQLYGIDIRVDTDGRSRPQGAGWDIGASEYM